MMVENKWYWISRQVPKLKSDLSIIDFKQLIAKGYQTNLSATNLYSIYKYPLFSAVFIGAGIGICAVETAGLEQAIFLTVLTIAAAGGAMNLNDINCLKKYFYKKENNQNSISS